MPARDDMIALIGIILFLAGITIQFGPGWSLITAGIVCIYTAIRLETKSDEPNKTTDTASPEILTVD